MMWMPWLVRKGSEERLLRAEWESVLMLREPSSLMLLERTTMADLRVAADWSGMILVRV